MSNKLIYLMSFVLVLAVTGTASAGQIITIDNPGFEDPVLAEDGWTWLDTPGWTQVGGEGAGVWNVTLSDFDPVIAPEGQNVVYTENAPTGVANGVAQVLTETFAGNTDYTLTVEVGNSWAYYWSGYSVQLLAGGIVIAEDNDTLWPDYMKWATSTVQYTYDSADSALVGQPLEIRLLNLGLDKDNPPGNTVGVEFDDVTLSYDAPNEPALLTNEDFEADLALVPNPGDTDVNAPTGWEYDRYYGYDVDPWLMNVSAIGDGSGGNVGVVFGTWNADAAWNPAVTAYPESAVEAGQYTLEITTVSTGGAGEGWLDVQLGWFENPADPWANYAEYAREWVDVSLFGDGVWTTLTWDFEIPADDPGIGMTWYFWLVGESYNDYVIVGDVKLTAAEPGVTIHVDPNGDIAAANELAQPGDTIEFAEGTYYLTSQIEIKDGVTYKGAGPGLTIIDGNDTTRAFVAWGDRSFNNGNENPNDSGPKGWVLEGMTIQNCVADTNDRFSYTASAFDMNDVFAENDTDGSGGLNPDEADADSSGIRLPGPDGIEGTEDDDLHRFAHIDTDGNGELSQAELLAQIAVAEDEFGDEDGDGGAITIDNGAVGTISNCNFLANHTPAGGGDDGGAVNITGLSVITINDCLFDGNYAVSPNSVAVDGSDGDAGHIKVQGHTSVGGFLIPGTTLICNRCVFLNGNAEDDAGAIQANAQGVIVRLDACWFEGNTAWDNGTVLQFPNEDQHEATVTNCVFVNNIAHSEADVGTSSDRMCEVRRNTKFINCTFVGNHVEDQDIIYNNANKADGDNDGTDDEMEDVTQVINCIFANNTFGPDAGNDHILSSRNSSFAINAVNCIFFNNLEADGTTLMAITNRTDAGSITDDPLLDAGYVPGVGSPAIDAGVDPATVGVTLTTDLNGDARPQGAGYDIGAYEVTDAPPAN